MPDKMSALPTIPATASTWTGCKAKSMPVTHGATWHDEEIVVPFLPSGLAI